MARYCWHKYAFFYYSCYVMLLMLRSAHCKWQILLEDTFIRRSASVKVSFTSLLLWESSDVTKHRTGPKYRSWILVKCVWCGAYYWFRLRKGTVYGFHAFLTCILLLLLLIQCKISLYLGPVRCFVTPGSKVHLWAQHSVMMGYS